MPWTSFHLIGYSLGGGISASFTSCFPQLVTSLVLIAPSGLVRQKHITWQSYVLYRTGGILPESLVRWLVRRRLTDPRAQAHKSKGNFLPEDAMTEEHEGSPDSAINTMIDSAVQWQLENHAGFLPAFISSIRYAPLLDQHETFRKIGRNVAESNGTTINDKVVLVLGKDDSIVLEDEVAADVRAAVGDERVHTIVINAGHDVAITKAAEVVDELWTFWNSSR